MLEEDRLAAQSRTPGFILWTLDDLIKAFK